MIWPLRKYRAERTEVNSKVPLKGGLSMLSKNINPYAEIHPQYEVFTPAGNFRLDFLIQLDDQNIAIECDGKDFHDQYHDEWRDAILLGFEKIDVIYRFRGTDLYFNIYDCIHVIFRFDQDFFNDRYQFNFPQLISDDLKEKLERDAWLADSEQNHIGYYIYSDEGYQNGARDPLIIRLSTPRQNL